MVTISTDVQKAANQAAKALGYTEAKPEQLDRNITIDVFASVFTLLPWGLAASPRWR